MIRIISVQFSEKELNIQRGRNMLEQLAIFACLDPSHLAQLEMLARQIRLKKGAVLFAPGDPTQNLYAH